MRHVFVGIADLIRYTTRTGAWWFPVVVVVLALGAFLAATAHVAVPTVVYVLF